MRFTNELRNSWAHKAANLVLIMSMLFAPAATLSIPGDVFAATSGPNNADDFANVDWSSGESWSSTSNAATSNNSYASVGVDDDDDRQSDYLHAEDFDFAIPSGATINGIEVRVERRASQSNEIRDELVRLVKDNVIVGDNKATNSSYDWGTSDVTETYGGSNDLWGTTWSASDINDHDFGVVFAVRHSSNNGSATAYVDHMTITVHYSEAVDACPNVSGMQESGPCADEICALAGGNWQNDDCVADLCPNVDGHQASVPCADSTCVANGGVWSDDECVEDACEQVIGHQASGPCADETCESQNGVWNGTSCDQDACENVPGFQMSGPCADDTCVSEGGTWNGTSCDIPVDICPAVEGIQTEGDCANDTCVEGGGIWENKGCVSDACPGVDGHQESGPCGNDICTQNGGSWINNLCMPDVCPDEEGFQAVGPCESDDVCPNDEGIQTDEEDCTPVLTAEESCENDGGFWNGESCEDPVCTSNQNYNEATNQCDDQYVPPTCAENQHLTGEAPNMTCEDNEVSPPDENETDQEQNPAPAPQSSGGGNGPIAGSMIGFPIIPQVLGASTATDAGPAASDTCSATLNSYLGLRSSANATQDVMALQEFLNSEIGAELDVNGQYDAPTIEAVKAFQLKYASEVLTPWGIEMPTGIVYKTTLRMIQKIQCPGSDIPMPELN